MTRREAISSSPIAQAFSGRSRYAHETTMPTNTAASNIAEEADAYLRTITNPTPMQPHSGIRLEYFTGNGLPLNTAAAAVKLDAARSLLPLGISELEIRQDIFKRHAVNELIAAQAQKNTGTVYVSASYSERKSAEEAANAKEEQLWREVKQLMDLGRSFREVDLHMRKSREGLSGHSPVAKHLLNART